MDSLYQELHAVILSACIFTSVPVSFAEPESDVVATATPTVSGTPAPSEYQLDVSRDAPNDGSSSVLTVADNASNEMAEYQTPIADNIDSEMAEYQTAIADNVDSEMAEYQTAIADNVDNDPDNVIPAPLTALHQEKYEYFNNDELKKEAEKVFCTMTISDRETSIIKKATITQNDSVVWREQRNGRLTAHDVYVRKESTDPEPLVKRIMGYEQNDLSHIPAINWGVQNESVARQQYATIMSIDHDGFTCNLTGLWVNPLYPHLGVSDHLQLLWKWPVGN